VEIVEIGEVWGYFAAVRIKMLCGESRRLYRILREVLDLDL